MSTTSEQEGRDRRARIIDQLSYLTDEVEALKVVVAGIPDAILTAQPYEGEPSVVELFADHLEQETSTRLRVVRQLTATDRTFPPEAEEPPTVDEHARPSIVETLEALSSARKKLVELACSCGASQWNATARVGDDDTTLADYLYGVIQEDRAVLSAAARRVHESRPIGSPGFGAR